MLGRGSKVIAGTIKGELTRADLERVLLEGFFPECALTRSRPSSARLACKNWVCLTPAMRRSPGTWPIS